MLIANYLRKRGLSAKSELHLFTPEPQPMPVAGPQLGDAVKQMLESKGIRFHPLHALTTVDADARTLRFQQGEAFPYDLLVAIASPPARGSARGASQYHFMNLPGRVWLENSRLYNKINETETIWPISPHFFLTLSCILAVMVWREQADREAAPGW